MFSVDLLKMAFDFMIDIYQIYMEKGAGMTESGTAGGLTIWTQNFAAALTSGEPAAVAGLFAQEGLWRDVIAFGWTLATHEGAVAIHALAATLGPFTVTHAQAEADGTAQEGFVRMDTSHGPVRGYVRLADGKCVTLLTMLEAIAGHPEAIGADRWSGLVDDPSGRNWQDLRADEAAALGVERQPYVLVVGAGQAGLALGARLRALGVPVLLIDKHPRVGDQWRSRYKSLTLHDPVWYDHLPYMPFPESWPVYTPKDKMGDWLELYASAMELDVWTGAELLGAVPPAEEGEAWSATVRRGDQVVTLHCAHLVLALGNAGFPSIPAIPGTERFAGPQCHSSAHPGGAGLAGRKVAVIGANNSAHDIAADLVENGAFPTMIQRSSTLVVRQQTMQQVMLAPLYSQQAVDAGITTEMADMLAISLPLRMAEQVHPGIWRAIREIDKDFYSALEAAGFALDFAEDGSGLAMKYLRSASGYYIDVGASQMVIDGRIAVKSGSAISAIDEGGVVMADDSRVDADAIIYATGFGSMEQWVARLISPEVARKVGRCWGYGSGFKGDPGPWEGEIRNMWKPTAQPGLWFMGGNLHQARLYSRPLAQQLKARFEGLPIRPIEPVR
jgi:putative flavoprotein involved in K+ transport